MMTHLMRLVLLLWLAWTALTPTYGYDPRVEPGCPMNDLPPGLEWRGCQTWEETFPGMQKDAAGLR